MRRRTGATASGTMAGGRVDRRGMHMQRARRIGEFDTLLLETTEYSEVDGLLNIHVDVVVGIEHEVDHLEDQRRIAVFLEMRAIETVVMLKPRLSRIDRTTSAHTA